MNGVLNIFKPKGMTSFDVVRQVKKVCNTSKVGHTGTLDPEATGVLPVCVGKATKIIDYIMNSEKVYEVEFKLGLKTTTYDLEGEVLEERSTEKLTEKCILDAVNFFVGDYLQVPPMYSALKQNGIRLYELARKGIEVERQGRKVTILKIDNIKINNPVVSMNVTCSKGTYIRSLCYDIGERLGVFATMTSLNRSKTSVFSQTESINIIDLSKENLSNYLISIEEALSVYDSIIVEEGFSKFLINGVKIGDKRLTKDEILEGKLYKVYDKDKVFLGLGKKDKEGFKIEKLLLV